MRVSKPIFVALHDVTLERGAVGAVVVRQNPVGMAAVSTPLGVHKAAEQHVEKV